MNIKEKADELVKEIQKKYRWYKIDILNRIAIASVEHTIEVLESIHTDNSEWMSKTNIEDIINEQTELLTELKSRI